jgi:RNA polymerase subunit RPABC4/transcription elongation factor Spt4
MDTKFCSKCGKLIWDWIEICPDCGAKQSEWEQGNKVIVHTLPVKEESDEQEEG